MLHLRSLTNKVSVNAIKSSHLTITLNNVEAFPKYLVCDLPTLRYVTARLATLVSIRPSERCLGKNSRSRGRSTL